MSDDRAERLHASLEKRRAIQAASFIPRPTHAEFCCECIEPMDAEIKRLTMKLKVMNGDRLATMQWVREACARIIDRHGLRPGLAGRVRALRLSGEAKS